MSPGRKPANTVTAKPVRVHNFVGYGPGEHLTREFDLAKHRRSRSVQGVDPAIDAVKINKQIKKRGLTGLRAIQRDAVNDLRSRPDSSVKVVNMDYALQDVIASELERQGVVKFEGKTKTVLDWKTLLSLRQKRHLIPQSLLAELQRVLVPGGKFYITCEVGIAIDQYLPQLREFFGTRNVYSRVLRKEAEKTKSVHILIRSLSSVPQLRIACTNRKPRRPRK